MPVSEPTSSVISCGLARTAGGPKTAPSTSWRTLPSEQSRYCQRGPPSVVSFFPNLLFKVVNSPLSERIRVIHLEDNLFSVRAFAVFNFLVSCDKKKLLKMIMDHHHQRVSISTDVSAPLSYLSPPKRFIKLSLIKHEEEKLSLYPCLICHLLCCCSGSFSQ